MNIHTIATTRKETPLAFRSIMANLYAYATEHKVRLIPDANNLNERDTSNFEQDTYCGVSMAHTNKWTLIISDIGLRIILVNTIGYSSKGGTNYSNFFVQYIINLVRVRGGTYVDIFDKEMADETIDILDNVLRSISCFLPSINETSLKRVDLCCNIRLYDEKKVKAYIEIAKRCSVMPKFKIDVYFDEEGRECLYDNGVKFINQGIQRLSYMTNINKC